MWLFQIQFILLNFKILELIGIGLGCDFVNVGLNLTEDLHLNVTIQDLS